MLPKVRGKNPRVEPAMNKVLADYIACIRKRMLVDFWVKDGVDAPMVIALDVWKELTTTSSRTIIRDTLPLREALAMNKLEGMTDKEFRAYLKESDDRNV